MRSRAERYQSPDDCADADPVEPLGRDDDSHGREQLVREQWVESTVVDPDRRTLQHLEIDEPGPLELPDEVTLRQGAGDSARPGRRVGEYLRRELLLLDGQVGNAELTAGAQDTGALGECPGLAR